MRKNRSRQLATVIAAAVFGVMLGLLVRSSLGLGESADAGSEMGTGEFGAGEKQTLSAISKSSKDEEKSTREALRLEARSQRLLWFATRAENADPEEMARLMRLAGNDIQVRKMLGVHWARLDPQHMFDTLARKFSAGAKYNYNLVRILCEEWAKSDAVALVAAFDDESAFPGIINSRMGATEALMQGDPEVGLGVLERWGVRHYVPRMRKVTEWAKADPRAAAEKVAAIDADYAGREALRAVASAWGESDPAAAIKFAASLSGAKRQEFAEGAMAIWAKNDLEAAIAFASEQEDVAFRGLLGAGLLATWGTQDPAAALDWAEQNLRSKLRSEAIGKLVGALVKKEPQAAQDLVSGMDGGGAQFVAARTLVETWIGKTDGKSIAAAVAWLDSLPDESLAQRVLSESSWRISMEQPGALAELLEGEHAHLVTGSALYDAIGSQVRKSPIAALEWVRGLPGGRTEALEQSVLNNWIQLQPAAASDWSTQAPAGPNRDYAINTIVRSFLHRPADQLMPWLERLEDSEQVRVRELVGELRANEEQKQKLAEVLSD